MTTLLHASYYSGIKFSLTSREKQKTDAGLTSHYRALLPPKRSISHISPSPSENPSSCLLLRAEAVRAPRPMPMPSPSERAASEAMLRRSLKSREMFVPRQDERISQPMKQALFECELQ